MKQSHHIPTAFKKEFSDWRLWWTRTIVMVVAALAGLTVVGLTWMSDRALEYFFDLRTYAWWLPLLWTPLCTVVIVWLTQRFSPGAAGSGIPQVMASLEPGVNEQERRLFVSVRMAIGKFFLTAWGLLAGLSLGREGPSVQIAAGVMLAARRWLPRRALVSEQGLLVAGGAAGISAAFNTPLAGIMFAIEELSRAPEKRNSGLIIGGIVLAGLIAQSIYGNANYFGVLHVTEMDFSIILPGVLVTLLCGVAGGLFSRLVIYSMDARSMDRINVFRRAHPARFAAACGLLVAVIGILTGGATFGSGYLYTRHMIEGTQDVPTIYVFCKFIVTWVTTWAGVPAGLFAPSLSIGAALGNDIAQFTHTYAPTLIALGMAGFLAAVTQAPLTSFIIVMEMVDGHAMVLSLMSCALGASMISRILSQPLYPSLARMQLLRLPRVKEQDAAEAENLEAERRATEQSTHGTASADAAAATATQAPAEASAHETQASSDSAEPADADVRDDLAKGKNGPADKPA